MYLVSEDIHYEKSELLTSLINQFFSFDDYRVDHEEHSLDELIGYLNSKSRLKQFEMKKVSDENTNWLIDKYPEPALIFPF